MTADTDLELALDRVVEAARAHLRAVRDAGDEDDERVWAAYVALNNISLAYDQLLEEAYGEVTPWDVAEEMSEDAADEEVADEDDLVEPLESGEQLRISVRQRRDYLIPQVSALLRSGTQARTELSEENDPSRSVEPVESVGEAVYELLQSGGGTLAGLDIPELVPQSGLVLVNVVEDTLSAEDLAAPPHAADELFALVDSPLVLSLYEPMDDAGALDGSPDGVAARVEEEDA